MIMATISQLIKPICSANEVKVFSLFFSFAKNGWWCVYERTEDKRLTEYYSK